MRHAAYCALALATVLLQVMFVDGLSLPGGTAPDIVLVLVVTLALTRGPVTGMLTGFFAGLALDLAPPGGYLIGGSALVFCVIGYGCGRLGRRADGSVPRRLAVAVIAVGAGEAALAASGLIAGDGAITLAAVSRGLPAAVLYDVLLCALLLSAVAARGRRSQAGQPGRLAIRPAGLAVTGAAGGSEPLRDLHRARAAGAYTHRARAATAYAATGYAARTYGGRPYVGRLDAGGADHIRLGRGAANGFSANGFSPDGGNGSRIDRVRLALARSARSEPRPATTLAAGRPERPGSARMGARAFRNRHAGSRPGSGADGQRRRPAHLRFRVSRSDSGHARPARQRAAGSPGLGLFPRNLFRRQPRMCRRVPRWSGARSAQHGGLSRGSGGRR